MIELHHGDCLEIMHLIPDKSVDMILCDLPYGTTQCSWDSVISLSKLWNEYKRMIKNTGNIVLFADEPFTSALIMSNIEWFKQRITWDKQVAGNFLNAKKMLLKVTEDVCLFTPSKLGNQTYNPQFNSKPEQFRRGDRKRENRQPFQGGYIGKTNGQVSPSYSEEISYPTNLCSLNSKLGDCNSINRVHPTQKPVELMEYLIKTYTNEGETVLDNCMGSGTTGVACINLNRYFMGIEKDESYFKISKKRIDERADYLKRNAEQISLPL